MAHRLLLCFRDDVSLVELTDRRAELAHPWGKDVLDPVSPGMVGVLSALSSEDGATEDDLAELVGGADDGIELATMYYRLAIWERLGLLVHRLVAEGRPIITIEPMIGARQFRLKEVARHDRFCLSRFTYCRRHNDGLILESPLSAARTTLHDPVSAAVLLEIAQPLTCLELTERIPGLTPELAQALVGLLASADLVVAESTATKVPGGEDPATAQWSFHDLLFHSRSRPGGHDYPIGVTYSFLDRIAPLPAVKPGMSGDVVSLHPSDVDLLMSEDLPFTRVLESRRSIRSYGAAPISSDQLGEFLYRVARVRGLTERDADQGMYYDASTRPYPSGGACYDLEIYVAVNKCTGLSTGMYHYDPLHHQLSRLTGDDELLAALLRHAAVAGQIESEPQLLLVLASRFQRLSWKYAGIAYSVTLKNVGVLYQTMYLVATAMGLAPCALGTGNSLLFSRIVGLDDLAEASVGEFILGSLPNG